MRLALNAGADKVSVNTAAVHDPVLITACAEDFGSQCVVVAIYAKREGRGWKVYTHGGRQRTEHDAADWAYEMQDRGAGEILLTSMDADGTTKGYDIKLTQLVADSVELVTLWRMWGPSNQVFSRPMPGCPGGLYPLRHHTVGDVRDTSRPGCWCSGKGSMMTGSSRDRAGRGD